MDRRSDNATSVDVEIDPHRRRHVLGRSLSQTDFALHITHIHHAYGLTAPTMMHIVLHVHLQRVYALFCFIVGLDLDRSFP